MKNRLIVLAGPTASGKTEVAVELAKRYPFRIISADSMQVYRFMDIGTGKSADKKGHHLIDVVDPDEDFTVADYKAMAEGMIEGAYGKGETPFLVGGSGLYIRAVIDGLCSAPGADRGVREKLAAEAGKSGTHHLYSRLEKVDPESARRIHPNDLRRVIRALEVYALTGIPISNFRRSTAKPRYALLMLGIDWPREKLYGRIDARCDRMLEGGLVDEVKHLFRMGYDTDLKSMDGLGYKETAGYLKGKYTLDEMIRLIKRNTRRYAKRQLTWFKKDERLYWISVKKGKIPYIIHCCTKYIDKFLGM